MVWLPLVMIKHIDWLIYFMVHTIVQQSYNNTAIICVITGSNIGMLPDGTNPLLEPMLVDQK